MMRPLYTTASYVALATVYAPAAIGRRLVRGVPLHARERLGHTPALPGTGPRAWLHAVSVGEAIAATPLVEGLRRRYPSLPLVMTTTTATGAAVVRERFSTQAIHRFFPLDLPGATRRTIAAVEPAFFIAMETELWPTLLRALAARKTPVMIANGRLSDRSFRRYQLVRGFMRDVLGDVSVFAMRSAEDARRVIALGARPERVFVTGNIKHDVGVDDPAGAAELWRRLLGFRHGAPVWVAGSTHRGEEDAVLAAHAEARRRVPDLALVLAPRHPERVPEVMALLEARGEPGVRRSALSQARAASGGPGRVVVLDTVGELAQLYAVADVVFMGGSLVAAGGHNMLEPAARGKPVLSGPHTDNFRDAAELLVACGAARIVADGGALASALLALLEDPAQRERLGASGRAAVASRHGAVREILDLAARFLAFPERS
ncbi:MAG TPA: 3-deoxy-D-manno-octulosonic acid transferase [Terriglobales bacterium]|nr:3-deoxy-D-manno-octulosonic acid transferase [Terriglobales bacterium]